MLNQIEEISDMPFAKVIKLFYEKDEVLINHMNTLRKELMELQYVFVGKNNICKQLWLPEYLANKFNNDPIIIMLEIEEIDLYNVKNFVCFDISSIDEGNDFFNYIFKDIKFKEMSTADNN